MANVMDLIKRFYSTFIRYFLIKLVFLYVYKWIQSHSIAVYICKQEYLILLVLLNWRRLLAQIFTIGSWLRTRPRMSVFITLVMEVIRLVASTKSVKCPFRRFDSRTGFGPHTNDLLWYLRLKETQTAISLQTPMLIWIMLFLFCLFPFHISVFCPVCSFWC